MTQPGVVSAKYNQLKLVYRFSENVSLQVGVAYRCRAVLENKTRLASVDLIGKKNQVILEYCINVQKCFKCYRSRNLKNVYFHSLFRKAAKLQVLQNCRYRICRKTRKWLRPRIPVVQFLPV